MIAGLTPHAAKGVPTSATTCGPRSVSGSGSANGSPSPERTDVGKVGDRVVVDLAGESVIVVRADDGLHAFYNVCQHRGAELVDRDGPPCGSFGAVIRCPYHGWTYGLDGRLRVTPFFERPDTGPMASRSGSASVAVAEWGGFVFVCDTPGADLATQLGAVVERVQRYPLAELRRGLTFRYDVAANWKVIAENYNECYHCGPVHPELCALVPAFRRGGEGLDWPDGIPHRDGAWTFTMSGTSARRPFAGLDEQERTRHKGELIYPNLLLSLSAEHVAAFRLASPRAGPDDRRVRPAVPPRRVGLAVVRSLRRRGPVGPRQPPGLGDVRAGPAGHVVAWLDRGWFAPMEDESADIARWYRRLMGEAVG